MHRSPGGVTCEASFPARRTARPDAAPGAGPPYTPAMRRWVCIVALLAGFSGDDYVRGARLREPVAIERLIDRAGPGSRTRADGGLVDRDRRLIPIRGQTPEARSGRRRPNRRVPVDSSPSSSPLVVAIRLALVAGPLPRRPASSAAAAASDTVRILMAPGRVARSGAPGRHRQRRGLGPAVREPDRDRREPPDPAGARRVVGVPRRRRDRRVPPPARPDVQRRLAADRRRTSSGAGSGSSTRPTRRRSSA